MNTISRFLILVAMVLYVLIGVQIVRHKQALKAISNDSIPMSTVVSPKAVSFDHSPNAVDVEYSARSRPGYNSESCDGESVCTSSYIISSVN
jgi:hypothetical protein